MAVETVTATVRGIPRAAMERAKRAAYANGVIPHPDGSASDTIRWILVQAYGEDASTLPPIPVVGQENN